MPPEASRPKVYIAGPDVFFPDIAVRAAAQKALCASLGLEALHPVDQPTLTAQRIYENNIALLRAADGVVANLDPFRGAEVDSGTAFEVGFAIALGKPVVGYVSSDQRVVDRVGVRCGPLTRDAAGLWRDRDGNLVEDFGLPANLMLAVPAPIVVGSFEPALRQLKRILAGPAAAHSPFAAGQ